MNGKILYQRKRRATVTQKIAVFLQYTVITLDSLTRKTAAFLISGYQKYLSPRKGYSCAHRVLYSGESCSQYVKRTILEQGLINAVYLSRQRFTACKSAHLILTAGHGRKTLISDGVHCDCFHVDHCS